tara:strand:- start:29 stop:1105 length:1077 start_codon:yes stop_codon:yes gene_type:complete
MAVFTAVDDTSTKFQTLLYTGDGGANRTINFGGNSDLQPDLLWGKKTSDTGNQYLADTSRGISIVSYANTDGVEANETSQYKSVHSDGWVQGVDNTNTNTATYATMGWKMNGGSTTAVSASGSGATQVLASTYQVDTDAKQSVCTWTGTGNVGTITHGLGVIPHFIIVLNRAGDDHATYYRGSFLEDHATDYFHLNQEIQFTDHSERWEDTQGTSTVFTIGTHAEVNSSGGTYVAYCFGNNIGYFQSGRYRGQGNAEGTYEYTGFEPGFVLFKEADETGPWGMYVSGNSTSGFSPVDKRLKADTDAASDTSNDNAVDFLSNGFKWRSGSGWNHDKEYAYMAWAKKPFVTSTGIPGTAS